MSKDAQEAIDEFIHLYVNLGDAEDAKKDLESLVENEYLRGWNDGHLI